MFNSAVLAVKPSVLFNSAVVAVTPSKMFNSAAVDVIVVPPREIDVVMIPAFTVPNLAAARVPENTSSLLVAST